MLMLAMHPHYQQQLYEELSCIKLSDDTDVNGEDLSHLKFLDMFIKETMRLFPAVPYLTRETSSDLILGTVCVFVLEYYENIISKLFLR